MKPPGPLASPSDAGRAPVSARFCVAGPADPNAAVLGSPSVISLLWARTKKKKKKKVIIKNLKKTGKHSYSC